MNGCEDCLFYVAPTKERVVKRNEMFQIKSKRGLSDLDTEIISTT